MEEISLYVHIPFCLKKCFYCDFPSLGGMEKYMVSYSQALAEEITNATKNKIIKTIFIGGGTPTYMSFEAWKILKNAFKNVYKSNDLEFTVEANPNTLDEKKLKLFKDIGINRLSIGLQAWQDDILKNIGRVHTRQDFIDSYNMARYFGFNNINIDIMLALPNQKMEHMEETLEKVIELNPEHISCYSLIIEEGTPFYNLNKQNKLILPNEEEERNMYWTAVDILKRNGYSQYEISNFSKENFECKHNLVYWNAEEYVGCGAAAHSFYENVRYKNINDIQFYINGINNKSSVKEEIYKNSRKDNMEEFIFLGLRKSKGVSVIEFNRRFNQDIYVVYGDTINKYISNGLLIKEDNMLYLSSKGIDLCNTVMSDFIQ